VNQRCRKEEKRSLNQPFQHGNCTSDEISDDVACLEVERIERKIEGSLIKAAESNKAGNQESEMEFEGGNLHEETIENALRPK